MALTPDQTTVYTDFEAFYKGPDGLPAFLQGDARAIAASNLALATAIQRQVTQWAAGGSIGGALNTMATNSSTMATNVGTISTEVADIANNVATMTTNSTTSATALNTISQAVYIETDSYIGTKVIP